MFRSIFRKISTKFIAHIDHRRPLITKNILSFISRKPKPIQMAFRAIEGTEVESAASPLVIVHELFSSKRDWKPICQAIQEKTKPSRKVIAVDIRNHGDSPHSPYHTYGHLSEDIVSFLKEMDHPRATLLGHSVGGRAAMYTALKHPQLVDRLIVVDTSPLTTSRSLMELESLFPRVKSISVPPEYSLQDGRETIKKYLKSTILNRTIVDFLLDNIKKTDNGRFIWGPNINVLHTNFKNMTHFPLEDLLAYQYRGPSLFIAGSRSDFLKLSEFEQIKRFFPKAELQFIDSGHNVHAEYPSEFAKSVVSFINQQSDS